MTKFFQKIIKNWVIIFIIGDILLVSLSIYIAFLLRFDGQIPIQHLNNLLAFTILAVIVTPSIFYFCNLYKISWSYVSLTDVPNVIKGVIGSTLILGAALFILRVYPPFEGFPRSILFIYPVFLFLFVGGLRFSKRIYWQLIRSKTLFPQELSPFPPLESKLFNEEHPRIILITGGAGYIGSVLSRQLLEGGYTVKVIDKLLFGSDPIEKLKANPNFQFIQGDILNINEMAKILVDVDAVVHLAAIVGEAACVSRKDIAIQTNYLGTISLARLCKAYGIKRFIYASTCSTYG